jgi:integrative and conjugative element protein (TIGR02256 family)
MPYSRIMGHASTLAEQVRYALTSDDALIRIWQRDPTCGAVEVYDVPVMGEQRLEFEDLGLYIDDGVLHQLRHLRQLEFPNETGGVLLGYYDFNIKAVVVIKGLPAPPDSKANSSSFERGIEGLAEAVRDVAERTADMVRYIGEWHSHPPGHSGSPSRDDLIQLIHLTLGMADDGLPAVQLIVGEEGVYVLQGLAR